MNTTHAQIASAPVLAALLTLVAVAGAPVVLTPGAIVELPEPAPRRVALGDLNGDGHLDAVISCWGSDSSAGALGIWMGTGTGAFDADLTLSGPSHPWGVLVADLTGDGRPEIIVTNGINGSTAVFVYCNTTIAGAAEPTFMAPFTLTAGQFPIGVFSGDFNGDSIMDLAVASNVSLGLSIFLGTGGGAFATGISIPSAGNATGLDGGDFNNDGQLDLAISNYGGVSHFAGSGTGSFQYSGGVMSGSLASDVCVGDFDNDGSLDCAGSAQYGDFIRLHHGTGAFGFTTIGSWSSPSWPADLVAVDLNGDGRSDVAAPCLSGKMVFVIASAPGNTWTNVSFTAPFFQPWGIAAGDMNEDGRPDLVFVMANLGEVGMLQILLNETEFPPACAAADLDCNGVVNGADLGLLLGAWGSRGAADLNQDGTVNGADLGLLLGEWE